MTPDEAKAWLEKRCSRMVPEGDGWSWESVVEPEAREVIALIDELTFKPVATVEPDPVATYGLPTLCVECMSMTYTVEHDRCGKCAAPKDTGPTRGNLVTVLIEHMFAIEERRAQPAPPLVMLDESDIYTETVARLRALFAEA